MARASVERHLWLSCQQQLVTLLVDPLLSAVWQLCIILPLPSSIPHKEWTLRIDLSTLTSLCVGSWLHHSLLCFTVLGQLLSDWTNFALFHARRSIHAPTPHPRASFTSSVQPLALIHAFHPLHECSITPFVCCAGGFMGASLDTRLNQDWRSVRLAPTCSESRRRVLASRCRCVCLAMARSASSTL